MKRPQTTRVRRFKPGQQAEDTLACIEVISGRRAGERLVLEPGSSRIGRASHLELSFDEDGISRVHAELHCDEDCIVTLMDRDSTNGTFVNGARVKRMALREGDRIHVGSQVQLRLVYRLPSELTEAPGPATLEPSPLTKREREVAQLVAEGYSNESVAAHLSISDRTVGNTCRTSTKSSASTPGSSSPAGCSLADSNRPAAHHRRRHGDGRDRRETHASSPTW